MSELADDIASAERLGVRVDRPSYGGLANFGPREVMSVGKAASAQSRAGLYGATGGMYEELGRTGLRHWGGFVFEEWLRELQTGRRAAEVYREMGDSDPIIGAILYAIEMLIRRVTWWVDPYDSSTDAKADAEFCWDALNDMEHSLPNTMAEILSFLQYGYSYMEIVLKHRNGMGTRDPSRRSKYDDGKVGVRKIALRSQDSLWKWAFNDDGSLEGMIQNPPPDYQLRFIPYEKALHFRTRLFKDNPEGRSILRTAYRPWYFLKNLQNVEGIGHERDLAGLPMLTAPEGVDLWDQNDPAMVNLRAAAQQVVSSIRRDEQEGILLPFGWQLELLSSGGSRQLDIGAAITRYEQRIATSVLADMILLGQDRVGSYALAGAKIDLFSACLDAYLDQMTSEITTRLFPLLLRLNGRDDAKAPQLKHGRVQSIDLDTLGNYIMRLANAGAPLFGSDLEDKLIPFLLGEAGLPQPDTDGTSPVAEAKVTRRNVLPAVAPGNQQRMVANQQQRVADGAPTATAQAQQARRAAGK